MNDYNTITNANTHSMVLVDHSVRTIRPAMGPGKIIRLQPNQAPKDSGKIFSPDLCAQSAGRGADLKPWRSASYSF